MAVHAPLFVRASRADKSAYVYWAPDLTGDVPDGYEIQVFPLDGDTAPAPFFVGYPQMQLLVPNLVNGHHYYIQVTAFRGAAFSPPVTTPTVVPTAKTVPQPPTNVRARAGNKSIVARWGTSPDNGGAAITAWRVRVRRTSDVALIQEIQVPASKFAHTFTGLPNDVEFFIRVRGRNAIGIGDFNRSDDVIPSKASDAIVVEIDHIGPDKIVNTRAGQSPQDAPRMTVKGMNLDQPWGSDADHALEWVLYTSSSHTTVVGTDSDTVDVNDEGSTSMTISAPVAPAGADVDSNHLIGPWRLRATYVADPSTGATQVAYSPDFYTTVAGSVVIGTVTPSPLHDGDDVTITGPDVGVTTIAEVTVAGNTVNVPVTRVDQNTVTLTMPEFGLQLAAGGDIALQYVYNGNVLLTGTFDIDWEPTSLAGGPPTGSPYVPPTEQPIPTGDVPYPLIIKRWVFRDQATGDTYTVPRNPDAMTSPFPTRNITTKHTTALDGKMLLLEGAPTPAQWQFSGTIQDAAHYEALRHWVNDVFHRVTITDHYGRDIDCVLLNYNPVPRRNLVPGKYWDHTYTIQALVVSVGPVASDVIPAA